MANKIIIVIDINMFIKTKKGFKYIVVKEFLKTFLFNKKKMNIILLAIQNQVTLGYN
jgi:hypothetical protein